MKDAVSHYVPPPNPLTSTAPQAFSDNLTMPVQRWLTSPMQGGRYGLNFGRRNVTTWPILLEAFSPDDEATLSLAMRVSAPLLDKLRNVAANNPHSNVFAPRRHRFERWLSSSPANADCTSTVVGCASGAASPRSGAGLSAAVDAPLGFDADYQVPQAAEGIMRRDDRGGRRQGGHDGGVH
jgi:hypothetical protein